MRFRLGRTEVQYLSLNGSIEERVNFGSAGQNDFCYSLKKASGDEFSGIFAGGRIAVSVPEKVIDRWVESDQVSIEGSQKLDEHTVLKFLIEKDFECLNAHNDEDQSDRYPHPKGGDAC